MGLLRAADSEEATLEMKTTGKKHPAKSQEQNIPDRKAKALAGYGAW